jgi:hypothetical protein
MIHKHGQSRHKDKSAVARRLGRASLIAAAGAIAIAITAVACSLANIKPVDCVSNAQCASHFGAGSECVDGYCTASPNAGCEKTTEAGFTCFSCPPKAGLEFENACTNAACEPFDDQKRLTKLTPDGGLPALP